MIGSSFLLVRGVLAVLVGVLAFLWPGLTIAVLVAVFGAFALVDGITNLILGFTRASRGGRSWALVIQGIAGVVAGVLTFVWPGVTALALLALIGAWAIVTGVLEIVAAVRLRRVVTGEWRLALSGALSVIFGILLFLFPIPGAIGIAWALGAYALVTGMILISLGVRLRSFALAT
jgi:uncharacterized membrane protein HdeD (DUF308 family)